MTGLGEGVVSAIVLGGTLLLTLGIAAIAVVGNSQLRLHALSLGSVGPIVMLLAAPFSGDGASVLIAILLAAFLAVTSAVSGHAIAGLMQKRQRDGRDGSER